MNEISQGKPLYQSVVEEGHYEVIKNWSRKGDFLQLINQNLIRIIGDLEGESVAKQVSAKGLSSIHKFISPDLRVDMQDRLAEAIKLPMLEITKAFAQEVLGLDHPFYLDLMVIARIHFPFVIAKKSSMSYLDYSTKRGRTEFKIAPEHTSGYHKNLPFPAWAHGPHADSWFGHSFDGINLWWGVDGVTRNSGMTFYPDFVGDNSIPVHDEPPYLAKNFPLPKPTLFELTPGEVIVFNSDTLHGTRVHTADVTRVSISTRINPDLPRFNSEKFRHVKLWLESSNLDAFMDAAKQSKLPTIEESHKLAGSLDTSTHLQELIFVAPKEDRGSIKGVYGNTCTKRLKTTLQKVPGIFDKEKGIISIFDHILQVGTKILVSVDEIEIVLARTSHGLRALSAICPHVGYNLAAGGHDDEQVFCSGHGLAFNWESGKSQCEDFSAQVFKAVDTPTGIQIYVGGF